MPPALKVKQFGLPRYVWLIAIGGGVVVGLYLRSRKAEQQAAVDSTAMGDGTATDDPYGAAASDPLEYNGLDGLPLGYYAPNSGVVDTGQNIPDAVDPSTSSQPIINVTTPDGSIEKKRVKPGPRGKPGKPGARGKKGKRGPAGPKGGVMGGGGPPKRPKIKPKPAPKKPGGGIAVVAKKKKKK